MRPTQFIEVDDLKERCSGKTRTMIRVLDSFLGTSAPLRDKLQSAEVASNLELMGKTLHSIKGLLREIAAKEAAGALEEFEAKLREQHELSAEDLSSVQSWMDSAAEAAEATKERLKQEPSAVGLPKV